MTKRSVFEGWLAEDEAILARYPIAPGDWAQAWAMRERHRLPGWAEQDLAELLQFNKELGASQETLRQIERLADPATRVVITGQQTALALGPLYTLYKALGAILHARRQQEETGRPVVPCFWMASEDHDFEEVRSVSWLGREGDLQSLRYEPSVDVNGQSMADVPVEASLHQLIERLEETTVESEFKAEVLQWLRQSLEQSSDLESFFGRALLGLLSRFGLVALSPYLMGLRRHAVRLFELELTTARRSSKAIVRAGEALSAAGYTPGLHRRPDDINFFIYDSGRRCKLSWSDDKIAVECLGEPVRETTAQALIEEVRANPRRLSTNVISRPITQDAALPTLAYVAGPGELTYFAQLREVYELWQTPMPMIILRPRVLLVDSRVRRFLEKSETTLDEFRRNDAKSFFRLMMLRSGGQEAIGSLEDAAKEMEAATEKLAGAIGDVSPGVKKALEKLRESQSRALQTVQERLEQELAQKNEAQVRRLERVEQWLRPDGQPQERVYSALSPLLINYGMQAVDRLLENINLNRNDEQVIEI